MSGVLKLNDAPIRTKSDGNFNFIALMDAASCFILSSAPVPTNATEPSRMEAVRLLNEGQTHKRQLPKTLFISSELKFRHTPRSAEPIFPGGEQ